MMMFGKEVPLYRPGPNERAAVFVPHNDAEQTVKDAFKNGSGMVGFGNADGSITVYYENNKFNDSSLFRWQDKCFKSYDRMTKGAPTVNKLTADAGSFYQVGLIEGYEILVTDMAQLLKWLERSGALETKPEGTTIHAGPAEKRKHT